MLRFHQSESASDAKSYYTRADYLAEGQEAVGPWGGRAALLLGLRGLVDKRSFDRLCDNLHPLTGEQLTARTRADRTVGNDLTFDAPKSVSLLYELTRDERIRDAFRLSVQETMRDIEAGITYVNGPTIGAEVHLPFGGVKETGNGHREAGTTVYDIFTEWKSIYVDYSGKLQKAQIDNAE